MNFDVDARTILRVNHGSHAYGLNTPTSDVDIKGVCIEPKTYHYGYLHNFEQHERMVAKGHETDLVIYSLKKFAKLAADCNPSIIEVLWVDDVDILFINEYGEQLRAAKHDFLSKKARFTFSGYAHSQLKRIKTHRAWLLDPPSAPPDRSDFGLSDVTKVSKSELGAYDSLVTDGVQVELPKDVVTLFTREKAYQAAKTHYDQYVNWVKTRNPARAELERQHGYDCKHGSHLIRLMLMCKEIMQLGVVVVKRPDREELLGIKRGKWTYDQLIETAEQIEAECDTLYETSELKSSPDYEMLNAMVVDMTERYVLLHG